MSHKPPPPGQPEIGRSRPDALHGTYLASASPATRWAARPRNWATITAACVALVCGVGWPLLTGYALGTVAGVTALWFGVRKLLTERRGARAIAYTPPTRDAEQPAERCCVCGAPETPYENCNGQRFCWPCADCPCNQTPCIRTGTNDLAVSGEAAARARKVRVGNAIREYLKAHSVPVLVDPLGRPLPSALGPSEYDVAAVAIDALAPELAPPCPTPETHNWGCPCDRAQRANAYREAADRLWDLGEGSAARQLGQWAQHLEQLDEAEGTSR
jgi:hypothetical protein